MPAADLLRAAALVLVLLGVACAPAGAQDAPPAQDTAAAQNAPADPAPQPQQPATGVQNASPQATVIQAGEPRLVFEREVFSYPGRSRRDPFQPLTGRNAGPLFSELTLNMIIYSDDPARSVVSVTDQSNRQYRLRRGDSVGTATVIDIGQTRVVFSVVDFGIRRQEVLDLKGKRRERNR